MTDVITARIIIPVAIPTILLLIDGLSIRLGSWKIRLCAGSLADLREVLVGDKYPWRSRPGQGVGYITSPSAISVAERRPSSPVKATGAARKALFIHHHCAAGDNQALIHTVEHRQSSSIWS
jgi:hypothetical protein